MNPGDILDKLGDYMLEKQIERIEGTLRGINGMRDDIIGKEMKYHTEDVYDHYLQNYASRAWDEGSYGRASSADWLVSHVEWKSQKQVGFINYVNEYGDPQTDMVSEEFIVPPYAETKNVKDEWGKSKTYHIFDGKLLEWS